MAGYISYEGFEINGDATLVYDRLKANMLDDLIWNLPSKWLFWPSTSNKLATTGINHPNRHPWDPYAGIPRKDFKNTCKMEVTQIWTCEDPSANLYARLKVTGSDGKVLYVTPQSTRTPGVPINAARPAVIEEKGMSRSLTVVGQHTDDYIQFTYGDDLWFTAGARMLGTNSGDGRCGLKGSKNWDTKGPQCPGKSIVSIALQLHVQFENLY